MRFVVVIEEKGEKIFVGPYRSFKKAEGDAKAWDAGFRRSTEVVPVQDPEEYLKEQS